MSAALLGLAGVVVLVVLVWAAAHSLGVRDGETRTLQDVGLAAVVTDPLRADQIPVNPGLVTPDPGAAAPRIPLHQQPPRPSPSDGEFSVGLNYCIAASQLTRQAAEHAAAFLQQNGVPAAAVQVVEGQWRGANNAGSWIVVDLRGITAKEYRDSVPKRLEVEEQLTRLGKVYRKDPKGRLDFGQFAWNKRMK